MRIERCEGCGFAAADYTHDDLLGTLRALAPIWRTMTDGIDAVVLVARAAADGCSAIERLRKSRIAIDAAMHRANIEEASAGTFPSEVTELEESVARLNATAGAMSEADWERGLIGDAVHVTTHHVREAGRGLHALGVGAPQQRGALVQVSASNGGVPKTALPSATITRGGVDGDQQSDRLHHGRPLQAVCLWSQDVIDALRAEGHPVHAGAAGENLTVSGIDWATIGPGVRLSVGDALLEISAFATPCAKNAQWFNDREFRRMDHTLHPGWSRAYAWVVDGGAVAPGDPVVVEP